MFWELGVSQQLKVEAGLESKETQLSLQMTQFRSFLWLSNKYAIVYMYHFFFSHSSVDGYLGCFHVLAIVNRASVNIGTHISFSVLVSSGYMPRSAIAGSYGGFILNFLRDLHTIFHSGCINLHSDQQCKSVSFSPHLFQLYCLQNF